MPQPNFSITVSKDPDALAREAAGAIEQFAQNFVAAHGAFNIALSGGATPKSVYALLRQSIKMPWPQTRLFWGDERYVPHDHADSNYRMVNEALLQNGPVPPENIFPIPTIQPTAADAAAYYEGTLLEKIARKSDDFPVFDLILLGIGPDGHTASIFPGTRAALEMARAECVCACGRRIETRNAGQDFCARSDRSSARGAAVAAMQKRGAIFPR